MHCTFMQIIVTDFKLLIYPIVTCTHLCLEYQGNDCTTTKGNIHSLKYNAGNFLYLPALYLLLLCNNIIIICLHVY